MPDVTLMLCMLVTSKWIYRSPAHISYRNYPALTPVSSIYVRSTTKLRFTFGLEYGVHRPSVREVSVIVGYRHMIAGTGNKGNTRS